MYGLLGLEQIFLRYSNFLESNKITTQKFQLKLIITTILITSLLSTIYFRFYFLRQIQVNIALLYFSSVSMVALLLLFNIFRLNSNFVFAQFISNFWKIILLVLAFVFFILKKSDLESMINLLMYGIILAFVFSLYHYIRKIQFVFNKNHSSREILATSFQFFISITSFSLLMFGDRFIIENKFGVEEFGNYFYLTNFFLAPFSILQNYIGFKQLVFFKKNFSIELFDSFNKKVLILGVFIAVILFAIPKVLQHIKIISFDFDRYNTVIIMLLVLGVIRLYSSSITSAFEAKTNFHSLMRANSIFLIVSFIIIMMAMLFLTSIKTIILIVILIWLLRILIFKKILIKQVINDAILQKEINEK